MKKGLMILLGVFFVLCFSCFVTAADTGETPDNASIQSPASSESISATYTFRAPVDGAQLGCSVPGCTEALANITNVSFQGSNDGVTWLTLGTNSSNVNNGSLSNWTFSYNTFNNNMRDNNTWRFRAVVRNESAVRFTTAANTGVIVDNTNPVVVITTSAGILSSGSIVATVDNASSCYIKFAGNTYDAVLNGQTCTYTLVAGSPPDLVYNAVMVGHDGTDITTSSPVTFTIDLFDDGSNNAVIGGVVADDVILQDNTARVYWFIAIVIGIAIYAALNKKKGRK